MPSTMFDSVQMSLEGKERGRATHRADSSNKIIDVPLDCERGFRGSNCCLLSETVDQVKSSRGGWFCPARSSCQ